VRGGEEQQINELKNGNSFDGDWNAPAPRAIETKEKRE
jgi:hypothetical protein